MTAIKERIFGAVTVMSEAEAMRLWNLIETTLAPHTWEDIKEVEPDETDLKMLDEMEENPDCHEFVSQAEVMKELGRM